MATVETPDDFVSLVDRLGDPAIVLDQHELDLSYRAVTAVLWTLDRRLRSMLRRHSEDTLLNVYMSDGWSAEISEVTVTTCGEHLVRRNGRYRHEFLLQRGIVRWRSENGDTELALHLRPPKGLKHGKGKWILFTAACDLPTLRDQGHTGPIWNVNIFDGAVVDSLCPLLEGRNEAWYDAPKTHRMPPSQLYELQNSEFHVAIKCTIHCCSKGVEKGLDPMGVGWGDVTDAAFNSMRADP